MYACAFHECSWRRLRLIRKKQLQSKRASREAAAVRHFDGAGGAATTTSAVGDGGGGSSKPGAEPHTCRTRPYHTAYVGATSATITSTTASWRPRRAPFFELDIELSAHPPTLPPTLAQVLDAAAAKTSECFRSGSEFISQSAAAPAADDEREKVVIAVVPSTEAAVVAAEDGISASNQPQQPQTRVSDQLASSLVGERSRMNHVYRLILKKELQLRQQVGIIRKAKVESSPSLDAGGGSGGAASSDVTVPSVAPQSLTLQRGGGSTAAATAAATAPAAPLLHPFDPVDEQDESVLQLRVYGRGDGVSGVGRLTSYSARLLLGMTYDKEDQCDMENDELRDGADDMGTFWTSAGDGSWGELDEVQALTAPCSSRTASSEMLTWSQLTPTAADDDVLLSSPQLLTQRECQHTVVTLEGGGGVSEPGGHVVEVPAQDLQPEAWRLQHQHEEQQQADVVAESAEDGNIVVFHQERAAGALQSMAGAAVAAVAPTAAPAIHGSGAATGRGSRSSSIRGHGRSSGGGVGSEGATSVSRRLRIEELKVRW